MRSQPLVCYRIGRGLVLNAVGFVSTSMDGILDMQRVGPIDLVLMILIVAG